MTVLFGTLFMPEITLLNFSFSISYDDDYYYDSDHFDTDHHHEDHQRGRNVVIDLFSKRSDLNSSGM